MKMEKSSMKMMMTLALLCCIMAPGSADDSPEAVERWFRYVLPFLRPRLTKLQFYYHENRVADYPTAVEVARANVTSTSPTNFGSTFVFDDPLTVSPDPNSQIVGRAQGLYSSASQSDPGFVLQINLVFTEGYYRGSTLSVLGRDAITKEYRELSILGGSGVFRLARGTISTHTYSLDQATLNAIVEYNVFVENYSII